MIKQVSFIVLFFLIGNAISAQNYCVQFSKEGERVLKVENGKNVSFILFGDSVWCKGELNRITEDSLFVEQKLSKDNTLRDDGAKSEIVAYALVHFRTLAYPKASRIIGATALITVFMATYVTAAVLTGAAAPAPIDLFWSESLDENGNSPPFYEKKIDFEEGWIASIVECE